jgi:hypothetical protein
MQPDAMAIFLPSDAPRPSDFRPIQGMATTAEKDDQIARLLSTVGAHATVFSRPQASIVSPKRASRPVAAMPDQKRTG